MRTLTHAALAGGLVAGSLLLAAPGAGAAPGSVTLCAKGVPKSETTSIELGFRYPSPYPDIEIVEGEGHYLTNNQCVTTAPAPAPSAAYADAFRTAKRVVLESSAGKTTLLDTDRIDFSLASGEAVTVTFFFDKKS